MAMAPVAYVLWQEYLRFDPRLKGIVADIPPAYDIRLPRLLDAIAIGCCFSSF